MNVVIQAKELGDWTVVSTGRYDLCLEFSAYKSIASSYEGVLEYRTKDKEWDISPDLDKCEPEFTGMIKWDGCGNFNFSPCGVMLHICGRDEFREIAALIDKLYDIAAKTMGVEI